MDVITMEKLLTYNHAAIPIDKIVLGKEYSLKELEKDFSLTEIQCFFKPINFKWEESVVESKVNKIK